MVNGTLKQAREGLGEQGLAAAGRADEQNVALAISTSSLEREAPVRVCRRL